MAKLLRSAEAKTPAQRSALARCLRGIVHVKAHRFGGIDALIPAVWRRTQLGEMALVSDGLSSVLPQADDDAFSLGRAWFTRRLIQERQGPTKIEPSDAAEMERVALDWDYNGN